MEKFDKIQVRNFVNIALTSVSHFLWQPVQAGRTCTRIWTNQRPGSPPLDQSEPGQASVMRNNMKSLQPRGPPSFRLSEPGKYFVYFSKQEKNPRKKNSKIKKTTKYFYNIMPFNVINTCIFHMSIKPCLYLAISLSGLATGDAILLV